jgi:hypothetical protein
MAAGRGSSSGAGTSRLRGNLAAVHAAAAVSLEEAPAQGIRYPPQMAGWRRSTHDDRSGGRSGIRSQVRGKSWHHRDDDDGDLEDEDVMAPVKKGRRTGARTGRVPKPYE